MRAAFRPRLLIVEANLRLPLHADMIINYGLYVANHTWQSEWAGGGACYASASRLAFLRLARAHGYSLVAEVAPDLYFVRDDVLAAAGAPFAHTNIITAIAIDAARAGIVGRVSGGQVRAQMPPCTEAEPLRCPSLPNTLNFGWGGRIATDCLRAFGERGFGNTSSLMVHDGHSHAHGRGHEGRAPQGRGS